jgi:uncharacterized protein (DUF305 family)
VLLLGLIAGMNQLYAQSMPMSMHMGQQMPATSNNAYLAMMDTMMTKMDGVPKPKSSETDFIQQMIPHHEGAIAMAKYEIQHGKNFDMIQLAKSILAEQTVEMQQMKLWLRNASAIQQPIPAGYSDAMGKTMTVMMDAMPANGLLKNTDNAFAQVMIPHHRAAIDMAKVVLKYTTDQQTIAFANQLISNEQVEVEQMSTFLK